VRLRQRLGQILVIFAVLTAKLLDRRQLRFGEIVLALDDIGSPTVLTHLGVIGIERDRVAAIVERAGSIRVGREVERVDRFLVPVSLGERSLTRLMRWAALLGGRPSSMPTSSKQIQIKPSKKSLDFLGFLGRIETFQGVTTNPNKKSFSAPSHCVVNVTPPFARPAAEAPAWVMQPPREGLATQNANKSQ
jgi:hypothetical protein